jgi:hypothetical protein
MNIFTSSVAIFSFITFQSALGQNEVQSIKTSTHPSEVKQINNTPVIYIHRSEPSGNQGGQKNVQPPANNNTRCIKKSAQQQEMDNKKKELKEPVKSNSGQ